MMKRYRIPETRLPFVNTEIAQVDVKGTPHLVSSVWGGHDNGRLYFWNPETGAHFMRRLPSPIPGAYMLKTGSDGYLYLGCGNGDLLRYDGGSDVFESLVSAHMRGIVWGGVVTDRHVFWNAFHGNCNGSVAVYDIEERRVTHTFAPLDTRQPNGLYGHRAMQAPDGRVIWSLDVPTARIVVINPQAMQRDSIVRSWLECSESSSCVFADDAHLVVFTSKGVHLVSYPEFEIVENIDPPPACHASSMNYSVVLNGYLYCRDTDAGDLWRMGLRDHAWNCVAPGWSRGELAVLSTWQGRDICAVTISGTALRFEPGSGRTSQLDLEATGILPAHALCAVPERNLIVGAPFINQRFWTLDLESGNGIDRGRAAPGGGQVNQIVWDVRTGRAMLSSYTSASVTAYDPDADGVWPENPVLLASARDHGQMRPLSLAHDGRYLWMGTNPHYGTLGGALCRIDPESGEIKVWRNLIADQGIMAVIPDAPRQRLFFSTCIHADCGSAAPTATTAMLAVFDMKRLVVTASRPAMPDADAVDLMAVLPDGRALFLRAGRISAWDPDADSINHWGIAPEAYRGLRIGPGGSPIIALTDKSIGVMRPDGPDGEYVYTPRIPEGTSMAQIAGEELFYAHGLEIVRVALRQIQDGPDHCSDSKASTLARI